MKKYFPILVSKKGELVALQHLEQNVKDSVSPVIEVIDKSIYKSLKEGEVEYHDTLMRFFKTHWSFFGNQVILDFSLFDGWSLHVDQVKTLLINLIESGVNIVFSIQKNSSPIYSSMVKELINNFNCDICIRTSNSSGGFLTFNEDVIELSSEYGVSSNNIVLLLDFGQITRDNYNIIATIAGQTILSLDASVKEWKNIVFASSSFPMSLTDFKVSKSEQRIKRYEWESWKTIISSDALRGIKYGDYGTKSAIFADVTYQGSVSLKYTDEEDYVIYRGEITVNHKYGHGQFIMHSKSLVSSQSYSGNDFSWGDLRYYEINLQDIDGKPGNATNWVQFSQNHHITLMHSIL